MLNLLSFTLQKKNDKGALQTILHRLRIGLILVVVVDLVGLGIQN